MGTTMRLSPPTSRTGLRRGRGRLLCLRTGAVSRSACAAEKERRRFFAISCLRSSPVERGFGAIKAALAPVFDVLNHIAAAAPVLRRPVLARHAATLLVAILSLESLR